MLFLLQDLFNIDWQTCCLTHEMLNCKCDGSGAIPFVMSHVEENLNKSEDDSSQWDCQLQVASLSKPTSCIKMNQLLQWQHFTQPIDLTILKVRSFGH